MTMTRIRSIALPLAAVLLLCGPGASGAGEPTGSATTPAATADDARPWNAVAASGRVETLGPAGHTGQWAPVSRGASIQPLSHIRTDARGRATLSRGLDVIIVSPDSEVLLPAGSRDSEVIRQTSGKVVYEVETRSGGRFEVVTPLLVAGVKGTQFSIHVEREIVAVDVVEGHVEILSLVGHERVDLFDGQMATVDRNGRLEIFRENDRRDDGRDPAHDARAVSIRKGTKSIVREAIHSDQLSDFMSELKGMLSDSYEDRKENHDVAMVLRDMAARTGVDYKVLDDLLEETKSLLDEDPSNGTLLGILRGGGN